ncbi:MAG TPA: histidine phosphatase family protein [Pseudoduganella sp.]|jgi:probable phosphoglycerate mutase
MSTDFTGLHETSSPAHASSPAGTSSPVETSLFVVRHGRTALNVEDRYLGALDPPLDALGLQQAAGLARLLHGQADVLVCSPRLRAVQTAQAMASAWDVPVRTLGQFAERDVGVYEGLTREEAQAAYPVLWGHDITRQWDRAPPGGESIAAVFERVAGGLATLQGDYAGRSVVLVAHGFVAKVIRAILAGMSREAFFRYSLKNGDVELYALSHEALARSAWRDGLRDAAGF